MTETQFTDGVLFAVLAYGACRFIYDTYWGNIG